MSVFTVRPYRLAGGWVFDDPATALIEEGLVRGADELLDIVVTSFGGGNDIQITFSDQPLMGKPTRGADFTLVGDRPGEEPELGMWYRCVELEREAWLCESLRLYFSSPPATLFVRAEPTGR